MPSSTTLATIEVPVKTLGQRRVKPSVYFRPIAQPISSSPATASQIQAIVDALLEARV